MIFMLDSTILNQVIDMLNEAVCVVKHDFTIEYFNPTAERITGLKSEEILGQDYRDIFTSETCGCSVLMNQTIETGKEFQNHPGSILASESACIPIRFSTKALKTNAGEISHAVAVFRDVTNLETLRKQLEGTYCCGDIISKNPRIRATLDMIPDVAISDSSVLILGPSGSGKELIARALHNQSPRKNARFVAVNCGAVPEHLLESELFGHVKGAFTDAYKDKPGKFSLAQNGTLFLDEVGDLPLSMQVKLLRVLQEKEYEPLGALSPQRTNARVIAATNKDLKLLMEEGSFRTDLYYRLNVIQFQLPDLKDRAEDIPLLINHFLKKFNAITDKNITEVHPQAMQILLNYNYPGNIRELENIIEHAFVLCKGSELTEKCLPPHLLESDYFQCDLKKDLKPSQNDQGTLHTSRMELIQSTLNKYNGNRKLTAKELGIHPATLWRQMKKFNIS
jgi:PAS domain S-box-containing protein